MAHSPPEDCYTSIVPGIHPFVGPVLSPQMVAAAPNLASLAYLRFRDPRCFRAGELHRHAAAWEGILSGQTSIHALDLLDVIRDGVKIHQLFRHYKGNFQGQCYDSDFPPPRMFKNAKICDKFPNFISNTLIDWVSSGAISVWGKVGEADPPYLTLPLTVEPSKPRLCHDERFLNLWIRDLPFKLDHLSDLPRYVLPGHFQTTFDDKSGYQHVKLHASSQPFFGLEFRGVYFVFCTLPFGWKASAFIYHQLGLAVTGAARSFGVPISQYIDDRHVGQLRPRLYANSASVPSEVLAVAGAYIICYLLIECGYFLNIQKSQALPSISVRFLGFLCDSSRQAFVLPEDKKQKFALLRESLLSSRFTDVRTLQRFAGKVSSFSLAVPGCRLYVREVFNAIARHTRQSRFSVCMSEELLAEIAYWRFIDNWVEDMPWRSERHVTVSVYSDASLRAWGAVLHKDGRAIVSRDYWQAQSGEDISVLEAKALLNALTAFEEHLHNARVDVYVDNLVLKSALDNDGCRNSLINTVIKDIYRHMRDWNFSVRASYVPSKHNPADMPSRQRSDIDCMLSSASWALVERCFGPHSFDLMALDCNCQKSSNGTPLPHFSPWPTPGSSGVNAFSHPLPQGHNIYVFPPFVLLGPLLRCIIDQCFHGVFTLVVPDLRPRRFWWATLQPFIVESLLLGKKGDPNVLLFPGQSSSVWTHRPLQWDLWAFRCKF